MLHEDSDTIANGNYKKLGSNFQKKTKNSDYTGLDRIYAQCDN